jgi:hypothetical protein
MIRAADIVHMAVLGFASESESLLPWLAILLPPGSLLFCSPNRSHRLLLLPFAVWAAAAGLTGDRELFFPASLSLAVALLLQQQPQIPWRQMTYSGMLTGQFLIIRQLQQATERVLLIECLSAIGILVFATILARYSGRGTGAQLYVILLSSLLSCWTLAI